MPQQGPTKSAPRKRDLRRKIMCENCDEQIPRERLRIVPETRYCVRCQPYFEAPKPRMAFNVTLKSDDIESVEQVVTWRGRK